MRKRERNSSGKRVVSFWVALMMLGTCLPFPAMAAEGSIEIQAFEPLAETAAEQRVPLGTPQENLLLPETLTAYVATPAAPVPPPVVEEENPAGSEPGEGAPAESVPTEAKPVETEPAETDGTLPPAPGDGGIKAVPIAADWRVAPAYDPDTAGTYVFTAILPQEYTLAEGITMPSVTIIVEDRDIVSGDQEVTAEGQDVVSGGQRALTLTQTVDDMEITLTAQAGVFPADARLRVEKIIETEKIEQIETAIQTALDASAPAPLDGDSEEDAKPKLLETVTFDIKVMGLDAEGREVELQPTLPEGMTAAAAVAVSFRNIELPAAGGGQTMEVYHVEDDLSAAEPVAAEVKADEGEITITPAHFSLYTLAQVNAAVPAAESVVLDFTRGAGGWNYGAAFGGTNTNSSSPEMGWAWYGTAADGYSAKTLVLSGLTFTTTNDNAIILPKGSTVVLADGSDNRVVSGTTAIRIAGEQGGTLTFKGGSGKLYAEARSNGIYVGTTTGGSSSIINIEGGHITAIATAGNGRGVYAYKNIASTSIYASVNIKGGTLYASGSFAQGWSSDVAKSGGAVVAGSGNSGITLGGNMRAVGSAGENASIFSLEEVAIFKHYAGGNTSDVHNNLSCFKVTDGTPAMASPNADTVYVYQVQGFTLDFTAAQGAWTYGKPFGGAGANTDALNEAGWAWYGTAGDGYDANTLVMDGLFFETGSATGLKLPANATVVVKGENRVASQYASNTSHTQGIYGGSSTGESNITFRGDGSLYVRGGQGMAGSDGGYNTTGLQIAGTLTLKENVSITAASGTVRSITVSSFTYGVDCKGLILQDNATLAAKSEDSGYLSTAVMIGAMGGEISGGKLTAIAGNATYASAAQSGSYGIRMLNGGDLAITGGIVTATAGNAAGVGASGGIEKRASSHGISQGVGNLTITGGVVTATAGDVTGTQNTGLDGYSLGILASATGKTAVIGGDAVVKATSGKVTSKDGVSYGLYMVTLNIGDTARVEIAAKSGKQVMGLRGNSLTISGNPTVTVSSEGTSGNYTRGINLANNLTVSGGALNVTATGSHATSDSTGIHVGNGGDADAIKISGGRVTVNCNGGAGGGKGIYAYYKTQMRVTGGTVYATGNTTAIRADTTTGGHTASITLNGMTAKGSPTYNTTEASLNNTATLSGGTQFVANGTEQKTVKITPATQTFTLDFTKSANAWNYGVPFGGTAVNSSSTDKGWAWYGAGGGTYAAKTLVLDGLDFTTSAATAITVPDGTTVVLKNSNRATSIYSGTINTHGVHCDGSLTIKGSGSLEVQGGSVTSYVDYYSIGIYTKKTLTIAEMANVTAKCSAASRMARGVQCGLQSTTDADSYKGMLVVERGATLTADASASSNYGSYLYGVVIFAQSAKVGASVISGTVTAKSGNAPADKMSCSYAFYAGSDLTIDGGRVTATAGNISHTGQYSCSSDGICVGGALIIKGDSVVTATGGNIATAVANDTGYGIVSGRDMTIRDGARVTAKSTDANRGYGIHSTTGSIVVALNGNGQIDCTAVTMAISTAQAGGTLNLDGMELKGSTAYNAAESALTDASLRSSDKKTIIAGTAGTGTAVKTARIIGTGSPTAQGIKFYRAGYNSDDALILETTAISYYKKLSSDLYGSAYGGYYRTAANSGNWAPLLFSNRETAVQVIGIKEDGTSVSNPQANTGAKTMEYGGQAYYYSTDEAAVPAANAVLGPEDGAYLGVHADSKAAANDLLTKIPQYTITYDAGGGSGATLPTGHKKLAGLPFTIPAVTGLAKAGVSLTGWMDQDGHAYDLGGAITADKDLTLTAQYDTNKVTVTLNQNGGTSGTASVLATAGQMMPALGALPLKENCTFAGYYDAGGVQYYDQNGAPLRIYPLSGGPAKLTARWASGEGIFAGRYSQYQVFDCHRTPAYPSAGQSFRVFQFANPFTDSGLVKNGSKVTIGQMSNAQISGKIFYFKPSGNPSNPFILWFASSVEEADAGGGVQVSKAGKIYSLGAEGFLFTSTTGNDYGYFISMKQAFKPGEEITYKPTNPGPITQEEAENTPADPTPWEPDASYTVTFDSNGATVVATPSKISVRKPQSGSVTLGNLPASPARTGYTFNGWYTAKTGGSKFDAYQTPVTGNMTVYAQWVKATNTTTSISLYKDNAVWTGQAVKVQPVDASGNLTDAPISTTYASRTKTYNTASGAVSAPGSYAVLLGGTDTGVRFTHTANAGDDVEVMFYSVAYKANGGTGSFPAGSVARKGSTYNVLFTPAPAKDGYTFVGWTDRPAAQQPAANDGYRLYEQGGGFTSLEIAGTTTLIAVFKQPAPTVGDSTEDFTVTQPDTVDGMGSITLNAGHGDPGDYEYSTDGGLTWNPWPDGGTLEAGQGANVQIRRPAIGSDLMSDSVVVTINTAKPFDNLVTVTGYKGVYDGKAHGIGILKAGDASDATVTFYADDTYTTAIAEPTAKDVTIADGVDTPQTVYYAVSKDGYATRKGSATISISKAELTAAYAGEVITFGQEPELKVSVTGFVGDETADNLDSADYTAPAIRWPPLTRSAPYQTQELAPEGGTAKNYTFRYVPGTLIVQYASMAGGVIAKGSVDTYNGNAHSISVTLSGDAANAQITYSTSQDGEYTSANPAFKDAGVYTVYYKVKKEGYQEITSSAQVVINRKAVSVAGVSVGTKPYDGNTSTENGEITLDGVVGNDDVTAKGTIVFTSKDVGSNKTVDVTGIALSGKAAGNYVLDSTTKSGIKTGAEITAKEVALTWENAGKRTYDGNASDVRATVTSGLVPGDVCQVIVAGGDKVNAGTYTATASLSNTNYIIQGYANTQSYTIEKAKLTATYGGATVIYLDTIPDAAKTVSVTGFVNGETAASLGNDYTAPTVTLPDLTPGSDGTPAKQDVTPADGSATNYEFAYVAGTFTVLSREFNVVLVKDYEGDYDGQSHTLIVENKDTAVKPNEIKVQYSIDGTNWSEEVPARIEAGKTEVQFKVSAKGFDEQAGAATITIHPKKVTPTISASATPTRVYNGGADATNQVTLGLTGVLDADKGFVTLNAGTVAFADKNVGEKKSVTAGSLTLTGNQAKNYVLAATTVSGGADLGAGITPLTATLDWEHADTRTYDGQPFDITASVTNCAGADICTVTVSGGKEKDVGTHTATATALSNGNYSLPDAATKAYTINPAKLTAQFKDETVVFGNKPALEIAVTGFQGGEDATSAAEYIAPTISTNPIPTNVTTHSIELVGGSAKNYTFDLKPGTLTITNADMSGGVSSHGYSGVYDGKSHGITVNIPSGAKVSYYTDGNHTNSSNNQFKDVTDGEITIYYKVERPNYADVSGSAAVVITAKTVTPSLQAGTAGSREYDGKLATTGTLALSGVVTGETLAASGSVAFTDPAAGKNKTVDITDISLTGGTADNYVLSTKELKGVATNAEIRPREVALTWSGDTGLVYTGTEKSVSAEVSNLVANDSCAVTVTGGAEKDAGEHIATATGLDNPNYRLPDPAPAKVYTIAPATLTATYKGETIGAATSPKLEVEVTGFVNDESAANAAGYAAPTITGTIPTSKGTHELTPSGGEADNYTFTYVAGTLAITDNPITGVTAKGYEGLYDQKMHDSVTVSGLQEGDTVQYSTGEGENWTSDNPQVGPVGDTPIQVKVTRPGFEELVLKVTASVKSTPIIQLDKPLFDKTDLQKVTLGGSVQQGGYPIASQGFAYRKAGDTVWTPLNPGTAGSGKTTYSQTVNGLAAGAEYEVRLTATDVAGNTASETLLFKTQPKNPPTGAIEGSVEDPDKDAVITVTIEMGNVIVASQGGLHSGQHFTFTGLEDGEYNLVATDGMHKVTRMVTVKDGGTTKLEVVRVGTKQSVVKVEGDAPPVAVDKLDDLFRTGLYTKNDAAQAAINGSGTVEIRLTAAEAKATAEITKIKEKAADKAQGLLVDLSVSMIITPKDALSTVEPVPVTEELLKIAIPLPDEAQGKSGYQLFRYHDGQVDELRQIAASDTPAVESFYVSGRYAYVFARKFSTYAIYYDTYTGGGHSSGNHTSNKKPQDKTDPIATPGATGADQWLNVQEHMAYIEGRSDGLVHPEDNITRAEVAMIFYRLLRDDVRAKYEASSNNFPDVAASGWYNEAVSTLTRAGIIAGRTDGTFGADLPITRAEFAAIASRFASEPYTGGDLFRDTANHWARDDINRAASYGWVNGTGDGSFAPDRTITRAEAIVIINRVLGRQPGSEEDLLPGMKAWPDNADPGQWYYLAIQEATNSHSFERKKNSIYETWTGLANK